MDLDENLMVVEGDVVTIEPPPCRCEFMNAWLEKHFGLFSDPLTYQYPPLTTDMRQTWRPPYDPMKRQHSPIVYYSEPTWVPVPLPDLPKPMYLPYSVPAPHLNPQVEVFKVVDSHGYVYNAFV